MSARDFALKGHTPFLVGVIMHIHHLKTDLNENFLTKFFCFDIMSVYPTKSQQLTRV